MTPDLSKWTDARHVDAVDFVRDQRYYLCGVGFDLKQINFQSVLGAESTFFGHGDEAEIASGFNNAILPIFSWAVARRLRLGGETHELTASRRPPLLSRRSRPQFLF